jgi:hypothetical protein
MLLTSKVADPNLCATFRNTAVGQVRMRTSPPAEGGFPRLGNEERLAPTPGSALADSSKSLAH